MSWLPRVAGHTRERVAREFDNLGPGACVAEISENLRANNPELLDMARRCAIDLGDAEEIMAGFGMFYRLLVVQSLDTLPASMPAAQAPRLDALPRVAPQTRDRVVKQIHERGAAAFTRDALAALEQANPELLQMAHRFSSRQGNYLGTMQGFALLYACLAAQAADDRAVLQ